MHCYEWELSSSTTTQVESSSHTEMFKLLQKWHSQITELDYIVEANNVVILDHAVDDDGDDGAFGSVYDLFAKMNEDDFNEEGDIGGDKKHGKRHSKKQSAMHIRKQSSGGIFRPTLSSFSDNHKNLRPPSAFLPIFQQSSNRMTGMMKRRESFGSLGTLSKSPFALTVNTKFAEEDDDDQLASFRFSPSPRTPRPRFSLGGGSIGGGSIGGGIPATPLSRVSSRGDVTDVAEDGEDEEDDDFVTWTVLVAGMRLLWTLDIRDAVFGVVGDLLHTIEMIKLLKKFNKMELKGRSLTTTSLERRSTAEMMDVGDGLILPVAARGFLENDPSGEYDSEEDDDEVPSSLMHLLLGRKESTASSIGNTEESDSIISPRVTIGDMASSGGHDLLGNETKRDSLEIPKMKKVPGSEKSFSAKEGSARHLSKDRRPSSTLSKRDLRHSIGEGRRRRSEVTTAHLNNTRPTTKNLLFVASLLALRSLLHQPTDFYQKYQLNKSPEEEQI